MKSIHLKTSKDFQRDFLLDFLLISDQFHSLPESKHFQKMLLGRFRGSSSKKIYFPCHFQLEFHWIEYLNSSQFPKQLRWFSWSTFSVWLASCPCGAGPSSQWDASARKVHVQRQVKNSCREFLVCSSNLTWGSSIHFFDRLTFPDNPRTVQSASLSTGPASVCPFPPPILSSAAIRV